MSIYHCDVGKKKLKIPDIWVSLYCKFDVRFPKITKYSSINYAILVEISRQIPDFLTL